jgi:hypothetical protein
MTDEVPVKPMMIQASNPTYNVLLFMLASVVEIPGGGSGNDVNLC